MPGGVLQVRELFEQSSDDSAGFLPGRKRLAQFVLCFLYRRVSGFTQLAILGEFLFDVLHRFLVRDRFLKGFEFRAGLTCTIAAPVSAAIPTTAAARGTASATKAAKARESAGAAGDALSLLDFDHERLNFVPPIRVALDIHQLPVALQLILPALLIAVGILRGGNVSGERNHGRERSQNERLAKYFFHVHSGNGAKDSTESRRVTSQENIRTFRRGKSCLNLRRVTNVPYAMNIQLRNPPNCPTMKFAAVVLFFALSATLPAQSRRANTNDVHYWLSNTFRSWLVRSYPDITSRNFPDWFQNHPAGLRPEPFTNWLSEVFPDLETETYPTWLENVSSEALGTNIPPWWKSVLAGKYSVAPLPQPVPNIIRGPYLQLGTTNSMILRWRTDVPTSNTVFYGSSPTRLTHSARANGTFTDHAVQFTNLQPNTKYFYAFGPNDTPLLVHLTNDIAFLRSTNSRIHVSKPGTHEQIAVATRDTFVFSIKDKHFSVTDLEQSFVENTTNDALVVNTPNAAVLLTISNGNHIIATTSNQMVWLTNPKMSSAQNFLAGTTNYIHTGGDSNSFFFTNPLIGKAQPVRVWVLGDPGTRKKAERDVRDAYYKWTGDRRTDFWLILGDIAYTAGKDSEYQGAVFQMYDAMLRKSVLWPALGNHDAGSANSSIAFGVYYDIFSLPSQAQAGGVMSGTEAYYSFDYANIHVVCLDSSDNAWSTNGLMLKWLQADLKANQQDWLIAYCHHPPYTKGSHNSDNDRDSDARMRMMRERVLPVLENYGLDLMLCGHSHAYERSFLVDGHYGNSWTLNEKLNFKSMNDGRKDGTGIYTKPSRGPAPHEGAVYVVAGSSGQTSGGSLQHPAMCLSLNVLGSLVLDFDGQSLDTTFIDDKACVRDYFTITKGQ